VLKQPIYLTDLRLDENDKTALRDYFAIAGQILPPLVAKYIKDHKLAATPEEIKEFNDRSAARLKETLKNPDISDKARRSLELLEKDANEPGKKDDGADEVAKHFVEAWKFNKALHKKYGGRIIFQQAGLEPLDAYRDWLRDEEKAGRFQLHDSKWKDAFWEYYKPKYHHFLDDPDLFKLPFWKMEPEGKAAVKEPGKK
jgi:hypothetical protein